MPFPTTTSPKFLLTSELAARWKLSPRTLERWRYCRVGPQFARVGGRVIYALDEVERFERSCNVDTYQ